MFPFGNEDYNESSSYSKIELSCLYFQDVVNGVLFYGATTAVEPVKSENNPIIGGKSNIQIKVAGEAKIEVYTYNGSLVKTINANNTVSINNLQAGLYLLKVNDKVYKTVVR
jgi:hypothetical protein